jgi:integrase
MTETRRRRQYGSGSIFQRASDGRVLGVIQAGWNERGGRRTITVSAAPKDDTKAALREAEAVVKRKMRDKLRAIERDGTPDGDDRTTVKAWAERWLAVEVGRLRPKSYTTTRAAIERWVIPTIGHRPLKALTPGDIRAVTKTMLEAGLKPSSAQRGHSVTLAMLKAATLEGHPVPQRVLLVKGPGLNESDREAMPTEEAAQMLATAALYLPHASRWVAALLQGMRQGECLGLTRGCDLGDELDISWQLQSLPYLDKHDRSKGFRVPVGYEARRLEGAYHLTRPKTARGRRIIPVVPWMRTALDAWYDVAPRSPHGLVWPAADGSPANPAADLDEWKGLQGAAGVGHPAGRFYVLHEARHTTATLLLELGVDRTIIERIVGQAKLVDSYLHPHKAAMRAALEQVAERLQLP